MAKTVSEEVLKHFALTLTDDVKINASATGDNEEISLLNYIREGLGECKIINDPQFFFWSYKYQKLPMCLYGYDIDEFDNSVSLFVSDFAEPLHTISQRSAQVMVDNALNFIRVAVRGEKSFKTILENEVFDLYDQLIQMNKTVAGLSKIKVIIASNGKRSARARVVLDSIANIDVEMFYWDVEWIYNNCNSEVETEEIIVDAHDEEYTNLMDGGLPCLPVPQMENQFECYQCVVPGKLLSYIYRKFGSTLLEGNVRSFLTTKTAVNKEIQGTILNEPGRFYIYNNGIAAIAAAVNVEKINGETKITRLEKIQIVNGGQTTASLAYSAQKRGADVSAISVPMKLTVIKADSDTKKDELDSLIQKISETSNSQNKVSAVDFFANHPFHIKMKKFSESISQPGINHATKWFYERTRGEYAQSMMFMTKMQQDSFKVIHPKEKLVTKSDFAKYYNLWRKHPDQVSKGGDTNFKAVADEITVDWKDDQAKYNEVFFKNVVSVGALYRALEPEITKTKQSWFGGSYRANIIAYSIAGLFWMVDKGGNKFDLLKIWDKGISDAFLSDMLDLCHYVYRIITADDRPTENVTQYCKRKECWETVKTALSSYQFPGVAINSYLVSKAESYQIAKEAKASQRIDDEATAYQMILRPPYKNNWMKLVKFLSSNRNLFPELTDGQVNKIMKVVNMDQGRISSVPTGEDCMLAMKWWNEAKKMGWTI
jgi:hypothetical protein